MLRHGDDDIRNLAKMVMGRLENKVIMVLGSASRIGAPMVRRLCAEGAQVSRTAHASFVLDALEQAIHDRRPVQRGGLIRYSDRGSQYVSIK